MGVLAVSLRHVRGCWCPCCFRPEYQPWPCFLSIVRSLHQGASPAGGGPCVWQCGGPGGGRYPQEAGQCCEGVQLGNSQHVHSCSLQLLVSRKVQLHCLHCLCNGAALHW